ncbi:MAG: carboxylating nicotinate-nucleotide diphosphorylase [Acidobacteriota bacterium]|nr:carboxylating nicotinate-nucleotide diphosphorylase [Acidobacteriota bacterium]
MSEVCNYLPRVRESVKALAGPAFEEDMPDGDITAAAMQLRGRNGRAHLITREPVPMCGAAWFDPVIDAYRAHEPQARLEVYSPIEDGQRVEAGTTLFELDGDVADIVAVERTLLNFLGRGIGIARQTAAFVDRIRATGNQRTQILDTRKTLPGFRYFDKYAVLCGGGQNHRLNLSDQVLIKENHLARFGGVARAVAHVRANLPRPVEIQIEVCNMDQLKEAVDAECPIIMLDNFEPEMVRRACDMPRGACLLEVSGGITLDNIDRFLQPNLDRISVGSLTHSVIAPDLSLLITEEDS